MPLVMKIPKKVQKLLAGNSKEGLRAQVRKEFKKKSPKKIKRRVVQDIIRGISPVKGKGKWVKYSQSYKDVIRNKAAFRTVGGKVIAIRADGGVTNKELKSLRGSKGAGQALSKVRARNKKQIRELNAAFHKRSNPTKQVSPVNLRHSGETINAFKVIPKGGLLRGFRLVFKIKHFLADIHNRLGAGKSKVKRRILPTRTGEQFNPSITNFIINELKSAANTVAKQFSRR